MYYGEKYNTQAEKFPRGERLEKQSDKQTPSKLVFFFYSVQKNIG